MRTEEIYVSTIDGAAERILQLLEDHIYGDRSVSSRNNVFYFDGWDGLGASAVLRALAERLTPTTPAGKKALAEQEFDQLVHIDCSMWESRRALQRAVAEQLQLPDHVMELFDRQDEEGDFKGVSKGSRAELPEVLRVMYQHVQNKSNGLLVIFHNGSSEEIDLASLCGFRLSGFATNKVLWTFQGRFRHRPRAKVDMAMKSAGTTDAFVSVVQPDVPEFDKPHLWSYLVSQEASELVTAHKINTRPHSTSDQPAQVHECFLYLLELCCRSTHSVDYDLTTHIPNYWVCYGIIHQLLRQGQRDDISADGDNDKLWRAAEALQREMQLDVDYHQYSPSSPLAKFVKSKPYWTSPTCGFTWIPASGAIPNKDTFQGYSDKLHVLKLSRCTFDFKSPPFICCHSLRFLWLNYCQGTRTSTDGGAGKEGDVRRCFQRLWVLDVRHTPCDQILSVQMLDLMTQLRELNMIGAQHWDMGQLQGRLPNIHKLRVKDSGVICSCSENDLFSEANKLELLDFPGSREIISSPMRSLSAQRVSSAACLTTADGGCKYEGVKSPSRSEQQVMVILQPQTAPAIYAADITVDYLKQTSEGNGDASGHIPLLVTISYPNGFSQLKTLEIMWCGDLEEALPLAINEYSAERLQQQLVILEFTSLKHIHLHELPRLRSICGIKISAPNLETIKIRGCWSLKSLPYVGSGSKVVECDCEKEWWDRLEWEDSSQVNRYKPIHSRYYKKTMLRGSVLR
nr:unnamed protein product [Digitaria exilis]